MEKNNGIDAFVKFGEEASVYGKQYGGDNFSEFYPEHKFRLAIFQNLLNEIKPKRLLDVGCGSGQPLLAFLKQGFDAFGFDFSAEMVEQTRQLLASNNLDASRVSQNNMEDSVGIEKGAFDCIVALGSLYYSRNFSKTMQNVSDILSDNGHIIFSLRNDLFSMFSQNKYSLDFILNKLIPVNQFSEELKESTIKFFETRYPKEHVAKVFATVDDKAIYSLFHNPLTVEEEVLKPAGLKLEGIYYYHFHALPPLFEHTNTLEFRQQSALLENPKDWRGAFMCSSFVVHASKRG